MITKLVEKLKGDKEFSFAYQSNIAMAVFDEIRRIKGYKSEAKLHSACNAGATEFLRRLCKESEEKR